MAADLTFDIAAIDRATRTFTRMGAQVERLERKLDRLDRKEASPTVDVDVDRALRKVQRLGDASTGVMASAFRLISARAALMGVAVAAALASLPAAAAVASAGIVSAVGGGLAAVGVIAAAQSEEVRAAWGSAVDRMKEKTRELAAPFESVLVEVAGMVESAFNDLAPTLGEAFAALAPTVTSFVDDVLSALRQLEPAIQPMTDAFSSLLDELGPQLPALFERLGDALSDLAQAVDDNAPAIASLVVAFGGLIEQALRLTAFLTRLFGVFTRGFQETAEVVLQATGVILRGFRFLINSALTAFDAILQGAAIAFSWVPGVGPKLQQAASQFSTFRDSVSGVFDDAIAQVDSWGVALDAMPKVVRLRGHIQDLERKIAVAKARIKSVPKSKRSDLRAHIDQLQRKVARAKAELRSVRSRTVTLTTVHRNIAVGGHPAPLRQHGGPVQAGRAFVVGEKRPELFVPDTDGRIVPKVPSPLPRPAAAAQPKVVIELQVSGGDLEEAVMRSLRKNIRTRGGDVQVVLGQGR